MGCACGDINCSCKTSCCCAVERCSCSLCCNIRDHGGHIIAAMIPSYASNSPTDQEPEVKDEAPVRKEKWLLEEFSDEGKKKLEEDYKPILPVTTSTITLSSDETIIVTNIIETPEVPVQEVTDKTPTSQFTAPTGKSASGTKEIQAQKPKASEAFLGTPAVKPSGMNIIQMPKFKGQQMVSIHQGNRISTSSQAESKSLTVLSALASLDGNLKKTKISAVKPAKTKDEELMDHAPAGFKIYLGSRHTTSFQLTQFQRFLDQRPMSVASPITWRTSIQNWVDASDPGAGSGEEQEPDLISRSLKTGKRNIKRRFTGAKKASSEYCMRKRPLAEKELKTRAKSYSMTRALNLHESSSPAKKIKKRRESCVFMTRETDDLPVADEIVPKETSRIASPTMDLKQESSATNYESEGKQAINQSGELEHDQH